VCSLFVMAATFAALALPAGAGDYPPSSTTPTSQPASAAARLAFTGSDSTPLVLIGIVAVTLGAVLVVAARRRGTAQPPRAA
jgi:LPXTG-motif cell wall-anchored protein